MSNDIEIIKEDRPSGLADCFSDIFSEIDYSEFLAPYTDFSKCYSKTLCSMHNKRCYIVTYKGKPGLLYVSFQSNKDRAKGEATRYFKLSGHPDFSGSLWRDLHTHSRGVVKPEWDKYMMKRKIPVIELMKFGAKFPCYLCGKHLFGVDDVERGKCVIVEGETELNPFTQGCVYCKRCAGKVN